MKNWKAFLAWFCIILYLFGFWGMLLHGATPLGDLTATSEVVLDSDLAVHPTFTQMNSTNATQDTEIATNAADVVRLQAEVLQLQTLVWTNSATYPVYTNLILEAVNAEAIARAAGDTVAMTNWQGLVFNMTNGAVKGASALQPKSTNGWQVGSHEGFFTKDELSSILATSRLDRATFSDSSTYSTNSGTAGSATTATYATSSGFATNAGYAASAAFATNAQTAVHAQTATALALPDGTTSWTQNGTNYVVTPDTNRVYIVSASANFNGGAVGSIYTTSDPGALVKVWLKSATQHIDFDGYAIYLNNEDVPGLWIQADASEYTSFPYTLDHTEMEAIGSCVINYVPVTNITVDVSAATVIILAARVGTNETDIAALKVGQSARPTFAATTNIVTALAGSGSVATIYTPIYAASTTVAVNATQAVYKATFGTAGAVTQSIAGLTVSGTQEARWELWLNATNPAALAPTWQSNLDWQNGTPDMTVTGLYRFAMSTAGNRITGKQTYPTVYEWETFPSASAIISLTTATNSSAAFISTKYDVLTFGEIYMKGAAGAFGKSYQVVVPAYAHGSAVIEVVGSGVVSSSGGRLKFADKVTAAMYTYNVNANGFMWYLRKTGTDNVTASQFWGRVRPANELETAAYNAGWRP